MEDSCARNKIDKLVADFFSAFDNRKGAPETANILACFTDKAVIARSSGLDTELYTVMEFAVPRIELLTQGTLVNFHEEEISSTTCVFGSIATRTSRYSKAGLLKGDQYAGVGTKCFQLVELTCGWRIVCLLWVDDHA